MDGNLIKEGLDLMVVGMGVVFAFLILMVGLMSLTGAFFQRFAHRFAEPAPPPVAKRDDAAAERIAVAIAAAHRARHKP